MRWYWIDRFEEFVSGQHATAIKNVSLAEEHLMGYLPGYPIFPQPLVLEGTAQAGGLLVGAETQFRMRLVLGKVTRAKFYFPARPGDQLRYRVQLNHVGSSGANLTATSHVDDALQAELEFFLAMLPERREAEELFDPPEFARVLRILRLYDVGRTPDGKPLPRPAWFTAA